MSEADVSGKPRECAVRRGWPLLATQAVGEGLNFLEVVATIGVRRSGGTVDAAVSKTVGVRAPCRFESGLRHHPSAGLRTGPLRDWGHTLSMPGSVAVARQPLELKSLVRIQAGQYSAIEW